MRQLGLQLGTILFGFRVKQGKNSPEKEKESGQVKQHEKTISEDEKTYKGKGRR